MEDTTNAEMVMSNYIYTSAKIEGAKYTLDECRNLIRKGKTVSTKSSAEAVMIQGMKCAYDYVMKTELGNEVSYNNILKIHKIAMTESLSLYELWAIRLVEVEIGGSEYIPTSGVNVLTSELKRIIMTSKKYTDPFERGVYLHCNIAYLQPFCDGNKRTSRFTQIMSMMASGIFPMYEQAGLIDEYIQSVASYYETGSYKEYASHFIRAYDANVNTLVKHMGITATSETTIKLDP
jgi:Fic family protein